jgi:hypothetical protein
MQAAARLLKRGCSVLAGVRASVQRDGQSVVVDAVQGRSEFAVESGGAFVTVTNDLSLLVEASALVFSGSLETPKSGWKLTVLDGPKANQVFEVLALPNGSCHEEMAGGNLLRIHLKRVA